MKFTSAVVIAACAAPALGNVLLYRSYGDCRDSSCPGGNCVSSNASDPNAGYICSFSTSTSSTGATINDCRTSASGCPGGSCVSSNASDPNAGYICSFTSASTTASVAVSSSAILPTTAKATSVVAATTAGAAAVTTNAAAAADAAASNASSTAAAVATVTVKASSADISAVFSFGLAAVMGVAGFLLL